MESCGTYAVFGCIDDLFDINVITERLSSAAFWKYTM